MTYYQLKQVDTDGSFDWSALRQVDGIRLDQDIIIHPNPVLDALQLRIGQVSSQTATIQIYKMNGAFVLERSYAIEPNQVLTIDETRQFPAGSYLLKVSFDQSKDGFTKRFIIDGN